MLADTAIAGRSSYVVLQVRRFLCSNSGCDRRTCVEQIDGLTTAYARTTPLLREILEKVTFALASRIEVGVCVDRAGCSPRIEVPERWVTGAIPTDRLLSFGESAAVMDRKATRAGEFVRLFRDDVDGDFFAGQVGAGQFEGLRGVGVFDVHGGWLGFLSAGCELFEGWVGRLVGFGFGFGRGR